jgi:hypothetical protein
LFGITFRCYLTDTKIDEYYQVANESLPTALSGFPKLQDFAIWRYEKETYDNSWYPAWHLSIADGLPGKQDPIE